MNAPANSSFPAPEEIDVPPGDAAIDPMESDLPIHAPPQLRPDEICPWCGDDNQCRVAKGHLYKGPCWCHEIIVPAHIVHRLTADQIEPACLCRPCLETIARLAHELDDTDEILAEARRLTSLKHDYYLDEFGNVVFTSRYHLRRGSCCDNDCRHCPY